MHWIKYFSQLNRSKTADDRLVMTILCRNEVDIIEENIRTHAQLGVDAFVVMDNGSDDGTREKLLALANEFELHLIDQPEQTYQQAKWMKSLAHYARDVLKANWVISNDADEFWIPQQNDHDLKSYLSHKDSVVTVKRHNMVLTEQVLDPAYHFSQAEYYVQYPFCYDKTAQMQDEKISMLFAPLSPKVIVNPHGFIKISGGNHRAKHIGKGFSARSEPNIIVYHYPIRSWQQFEANIQHRQKLLMNPNARMGNHYRRWVSILEQGLLEMEFKKMLLNQQQLSSLESLGVIGCLSRPIVVKPNSF
ncbi:MAG: glycosyltransferase family 2 protein [Piscirickettsiaceae bacterium CG_4_9_14_3_um_filter_43_564]|nr:MAG: hypothetical protein COW74_03525 [Piscirickettsiaceae bacterium CG18_big_fil_WC_8_21_14_2_50_44_103]PIU39574.1 MAG: glycosyltransferase family 2 protein [Piscirickettsiaceae bacterium CG07_land_8_20_14_0_80_44_28]PIX80691.1 MAG: glycosyltransferase family 2 protein [Piscirickettsiaceae bacterium CG_4_10_14_3_um_filter_44_349]PIY77227.1 MAG: glycosyltransferase family 2 protein [Piscirickettsiaceae bacterium CG_4_10_14_0_8_um_filter_44_742]PJA66287.1 MAG: glycosyltransferase family 2 pro